MSEKVKEIAEKIKKFLEEFLGKNPQFVGKIELNFFKGGLANINIKQSVKLDK